MFNTFNVPTLKDRTVVNGETAIKPYYYMRNGLLHVRFTVDRCIELSKTEEEQVKKDLTACPEKKQSILSKKWNFFTVMVKKAIIFDGIKAGDERMKKMTEEYNARHSH